MMKKLAALLVALSLAGFSLTLMAEDSAPQKDGAANVKPKLVEVIEIDWGISDDDSGTGYD